MQKAGESDQGVLRRLSEHETAFAGLSVEAAAAQMPRLQVGAVVGSFLGVCREGRYGPSSWEQGHGSGLLIYVSAMCALKQSKQLPALPRLPRRPPWWLPAPTTPWRWWPRFAATWTHCR